MKQDEVIKKIQRACNCGRKEGQLGPKNNDECYTQKQDILQELSQWAELGKFRDKSIICPCDTPESAFVQVLTENKEAWGIKAISHSYYNPATGEGTKYQDVDYSKYDICITNPPFNRYRDFAEAIIGKIDFIVLAPFLSRGYPSIFKHALTKQVYLGFGVHLALTFINPLGNKAVACDWLTSFPEAQAERNNKRFKSGLKYELYKDEYEVMPKMIMKDGTHPIRVSTTTYPEDYDGWMFASISVLDYLDQESYEWYATNCKGLFNSNPDISPFAHKTCDEIYRHLDGKLGFHGIVFRKKQGG